MLRPSLGAAWLAWAIWAASRLRRRALGRCRATKPARRAAHMAPTLPFAGAPDSTPPARPKWRGLDLWLGWRYHGRNCSYSQVILWLPSRKSASPCRRRWWPLYAARSIPASTPPAVKSFATHCATGRRNAAALKAPNAPVITKIGIPVPPYNGEPRKEFSLWNRRSNLCDQNRNGKSRMFKRLLYGLATNE